MSTSTRTEKIVRKLETEILTGALKPGDRLDEVELARRFEVSRTPIHDALRHLAASGLVEIRPRQSALVASLTIPRLLQMFEVMAQLEGMCARLASSRITGEHRELLREANEGCATALQSGNVSGFYDANDTFHETVRLAAGNAFLYEEAVALQNRLAPYRRQVTYQPGRMKASIEEHQRILDAIVGVKPIAAEIAMRAHVELLGSGVSDFVAALAGDTTDHGAASEIMSFVGSLG
jgi:DNA-binding GntR family transcriptional regulator